MRAPLTLLLVPLATCAQTADPLQTSACRQALQQLRATEAAVVAAAGPSSQADAGVTPPRAVAPALLAARRQAAHACLGTRLDPVPAAGRLAQPPAAVAPSVGNSTIPLPSRALPAAPQPAPRVPNAPLNAITSCDANGCWSSDGTRLMRQGGGALLGPRGYCTVSGSVVTCP